MSGYGAGILVGIVLLMLTSCSGPPESSARNETYTYLGDLVATGLVYRDPRTLEPFNGLVFSTFPPDSRRIRMRGRLVDGLLSGDVELFAPDGQEVWTSVKYVSGHECGVWTLSPFGRLVQDSLFWASEVESRVLIPFGAREAGPGESQVVEYQTDNPRCSEVVARFESGLDAQNNVWVEDPYGLR